MLDPKRWIYMHGRDRIFARWKTTNSKILHSTGTNIKLFTYIGRISDTTTKVLKFFFDGSGSGKTVLIWIHFHSLQPPKTVLSPSVLGLKAEFPSEGTLPYCSNHTEWNPSKFLKMLKSVLQTIGLPLAHARRKLICPMFFKAALWCVDPNVFYSDPDPVPSLLPRSL